VAPGGAAFDTVSDLHNNAVGALIIRTIPVPFAPDLIDHVQIKTELLQMLQDGILWRTDASGNQVERTNGESIVEE